MASRVARFTHRFRGSPERVWTALADTARFNEAAGFPLHRITEEARGDGTQLFRGDVKIGPFSVIWEDLPANWVREQWFEHTRLLERGPISRLSARLDLVREETGCTGNYQIEVDARSLTGRLVVAPILLAKGIGAVRRLALQADSFAIGQRETPFQVEPPKLGAERHRRAERIAGELYAAGHRQPLVERLKKLVLGGAENDVERIRPLALARRWGEPPMELVRLCLNATRHGLLALSWDLLCPRCRGAKSRSSSLDELPRGAHCPTCAVDYGRDFSSNVEATFRPADAIRNIATGEFCMLGPMSTPHILAHLTLRAGERRAFRLHLEPGPYRLRTLEPGPELLIDHAGHALPVVTLAGETMRLQSEGPELVLQNAGSATRTFVLEERAWIADALTGDRLTALQDFRDLFSDQVLRPGDEVGIERVAILFSDLRGSTALYERLGDAGAYQRVREHFGYLTSLVREHDGAVVKTIGDAVMAVFADPTRAVAAALAMQGHIDELNTTDAAPLVLKLGLHAGACIAVTLNDRLDYFGRTVNLAARLQGTSQGGDIVLSKEVAADPEVARLLTGYRLEAGEVTLRGFAAPVSHVRIAAEREPGC